MDECSPDRPRPAAVDLVGVTVGYEGEPDVVHDVTLTVATGSTMVLLGPSGCGKTTLLRSIAGLERPRSGVIGIGGRVVSDASRWVPPERRNVGMVFQDPSLFPHLSVADNVAFGLRSRGDRRRRAERVEAMLALVELGAFADRRPGTLSGGQQQRVALARSLAPQPDVLLLDEPFSALDASLRAQLRSEVAGILGAIDVTAVLVTHDQDEAFALGDRVGVMREGRLEQVATPEELYLRPADPWVAGFVGETNLVRGDATGLFAATSIGTIALHDAVHGEVEVMVRPEHVAVRNGDAAVVERVEYFGHDVRYELRTDTGMALVARVQGDERRRVGDRVDVGYRGGATAAWPVRAV